MKKKPLKVQQHKEPKAPSKEEGLGPGSYNIKEASLAPKFSFGVKAGGDPKDHSLMVPRHLRSAKSENPGPGNYKEMSSIRQNNRHLGSMQDCTW